MKKIKGPITWCTCVRSYHAYYNGSTMLHKKNKIIIYISNTNINTSVLRCSLYTRVQYRMCILRFEKNELLTFILFFRHLGLCGLFFVGTQPTICVHSSHRTRTSTGYCLPIYTIRYITTSKYTFDICEC